MGVSRRTINKMYSFFNVQILPLQYKGYYKALVMLRLQFDSVWRLHETLLINVNFQKLSLITSEMSAHEYIKSTNQLFKRCIDSKILQGVILEFYLGEKFLYMALQSSWLERQTVNLCQRRFKSFKSRHAYLPSVEKVEAV